MSEKIIIDTFGSKDTPAMSRFGDGASSLNDVTESLRQRDALRNEQIEQSEKGGPVRRDQ